MFLELLQDIESQFSSTEWTNKGIATYPANYQGAKSDSNEYCVLSVLPSTGRDYAFGAKKSLKGLVAVKIFVKAGEGSNRLMELCGELDTLLQQRQLSGGTVLDTSYFNVEGLDPANSSLFSGTYFIPFTLYGE